MSNPYHNKVNKKLMAIGEEEGKYLVLYDGTGGASLIYDFSIDALIYRANVGGREFEAEMPNGFDFMSACTALFAAEGSRRNRED